MERMLCEVIVGIRSISILVEAADHEPRGAPSADVADAVRSSPSSPIPGAPGVIEMRRRE